LSTFELRAACGVRVVVTDLGATLMRVDAPDRDGRVANVLLGYDAPGDYPAAGAPGDDAYMGATCGRYANRIAGATFSLDGVRYVLAANEGQHQLHGGPRGFHQAIWQVEHADAQRVTMRHHSPDGDQGFPGALDAAAEFSLSDDGELAIVYRATTTRATHVNLVSHGYFNLSGGRDATILDHELRIDAEAFLPIDAAAIPTGERRAVAGTAFDFTAPRRVGEAIDADDAQIVAGDGHNHNYVLRGEGIRPVAVLRDPGSGRTLTVATDQPGLQFYSGNGLGGAFGRRAGLCLEAQAWPDSPNRADFPGTRLDPGATYRAETRLRFGVD
jgi:aldose 1-epimerase